MRKHIPIFAFIAIILLALTTCTVFQEQSVTNDTVTITVPGDGTTVTSLNMTFSWSEFQSSNVIKYNLQVVSPDFVNPTFFAVDTITSKTKYTRTVRPGRYQCKVNIHSGTSRSAYTTISFVVDTAKQPVGVVNLISPSDGLKTRSKNVVLAWDAIKYATKYKIQVILLDSNKNVVERVRETDTVATKVSYTLNPGFYRWQVRAYNNSYTTEFTTRNFIIDTAVSISGQPMGVLSPSDNVYLNKKTQQFKWQKIPYATSYRL
jgi:hypothetical protein